MKVIINGLIIFCLTGCIQPSVVKPVRLHELSNDELCLALGTYNDDSKLVLDIHNEMSKRTVEVNEINNERCHALEIKAREDNKRINSNINSLNKDHPHSPSDIRNDNSLLYPSNDINSIYGGPKSRPPLYKVDSNPFPK